MKMPLLSVVNEFTQLRHYENRTGPVVDTCGTPKNFFNVDVFSLRMYYT